MARFRTIAIAFACLLLAVAPAGGVEPRALTLHEAGRWLGNGVSYGPFRDGQAPGGAMPSREEVREDLHLIAGRFASIRMYGVDEATEHALAVIREDALPLRVMLGAWIGSEETLDGERNATGVLEHARDANRAQVAGVIRLANAYPDVVWAVNVGNESQVFWSGHAVRREVLIGYLREVRGAVACPVTTCDDYNFWNKPESEAVAAEIDFIGLHLYAMWNGKTLEEAMPWLRAQHADVASRHPGLPIVHTEIGWATSVADHGEQAELIKGTPGEAEQELYYRTYTSWAREVGQPYFYFEAFDENWKGGGDPAEVEKHWGLWRADRSPKMAVDTEPVRPGG